jgi:hypothetical protein
MTLVAGVWKSLESCGISWWTVSGDFIRSGGALQSAGVERRDMYFEFRIRLEPLLKSITPIFPFFLCSPLPLTFPSVSTLQERTQQNHRPNNQHWTRTECRNLGLHPSSSIYARPFLLEKPSKFSHWSRWFWLWFGASRVRLWVRMGERVILL